MEAKESIVLKELLTSIIEKNVTTDTYIWLQDKAAQVCKNDTFQLNLTFTIMPRKTGKKELVVSLTDLQLVSAYLPGLTVQHWTIDRLCRVWLLIQLESEEKESYVRSIENLFPQAEMNELMALYSSLPLLAYPETWILRCSEGVRSNMGTAMEAIMYHNPYPARWLQEMAWNQMVMRAFFTNKNVNNIIGLDERANQNLANILFDYVEERWAAHRKMDPQIWRLIGPFIDHAHFYMMEKLLKEGDETDKQAAALALSVSSFEKTKLLLNQFPDYKSSIVQKKLTWNLLANKE